jgi:hypothetical protein
MSQQKGGDMKKVLIIFFVLFFFVETSNSEPPAAIKYLMNEPLSMFEWGLYRMEKGLNDYFGPTYDDTVDISTTVVYRWESNKIEVGILAGSFANFKNKNVAKKACIKIVNIVRGLLGIDYKTGKQLENFNLYRDYFSHIYFKNPDEPKNIEDSLNGLTEIQIGANYKSKGHTIMLLCTAPLSGVNMKFTEHKLE